jgi:hypothetical protein
MPSVFWYNKVKYIIDYYSNESQWYHNVLPCQQSSFIWSSCGHFVKRYVVYLLVCIEIQCIEVTNSYRSKTAHTLEKAIRNTSF